MKFTATDRLLDSLEGAVIVSGHVEEDEGMHIVLQDGRVLIVAGVFALSLMRFDTEKLH